MEDPKRWIASVTLLLAVFAAGPTQAAPFDEKAKAPRVATSQALRTKLEAHFAAFQRKQQDPDPAAFIRDAPPTGNGRICTSPCSWRWMRRTAQGPRRLRPGRQPRRKICRRSACVPAVGATRFAAQQSDEPGSGRVLRAGTQARGFRERTSTHCEAYLATTTRTGVQTKGRQLVETFARRLQGQRKAGQQLNLQEVLAYRYQKASLRAEAERSGRSA